jgi:aminopeptidase N
LYSWEQYGGGALTIHALRLKVGDDAFFKILYTYLERYCYSNASAQDFIALSEEISRQELSAFFDAWLLGTNPPDFPEPSK